MIKEVMIGLVSAIVTMLLMLVIAFFLGFFEDEVSNKNARKIADMMAADDARLQIILTAMDKSGKFKGEKGEKGERGVTGETTNICGKIIHLKNQFHRDDRVLTAHSNGNVSLFKGDNEKAGEWLVVCQTKPQTQLAPEFEQEPEPVEKPAIEPEAKPEKGG